MDGKEMCCYLAATSTITPSVIPRVNYFLLYQDRISLSYFTDKDGSSLEGEANIVWVQKNVLPKLMKWTGEVDEDGTVENKGSLRLVDVQEYNQLYQKLKIKYGQSLVKVEVSKTAFVNWDRGGRIADDIANDGIKPTVGIKERGRTTNTAQEPQAHIQHFTTEVIQVPVPEWSDSTQNSD
ncbi:putative tRNA (uracil-O(2)-)-methyltransferase-like 2 [Homarus americanus]|uniref:Putative tRNA (Uracil-O(2)-)-methyltransferase-like 2 n=1 Tax=Homarus americanus TaxID=6706 RepID=A0A8J5K297_HOMAM|nr:putative tRNA (uracil-O(2)-)-methyltransferase-like 2 [Homarus americanus]